jgi:hypothetical protein
MEQEPHAAGFLKLRKIMMAGKGALIAEKNNSLPSIKIDAYTQNETPKGFVKQSSRSFQRMARLRMETSGKSY